MSERTAKNTLTLENVREELMKIIKKEFISQLDKDESGKDKKHYYNEAQIQYKLAVELYKNFGIEPTLEWYVGKWDDGTKKYIDMVFEVEGKKVGIELKYKTQKLKTGDYTNQGAQNNGKFHFFKDIERLEMLKGDKAKIEKGFAILITNDHLYWNAAKTETSVARFNLCDGEKLQEKTYRADWRVQQKYKDVSVKLSKSYTVRWEPAAADMPEKDNTKNNNTKKDGKTFRCLIIEVK